MKVILKENIEKLGEMGSVVEVADGYARNYLIPRNLALEASLKNIKKFEHERNIILKRAEKVKKKAEELAERISKITVNIKAQTGEDDKLFGSVTSMDIADALLKQGIEIDRRKIIMPKEPIKRLGSYTVEIKLHPQVTASLNIEVEKQG